MEPPIPLPTGKTCPRCGAFVEDTGQTYCPRCGASPSQASAPVSAIKVIGMVFLSMIALAFGGMGACFLLLGALGGMDTGLSAVAAIFLLVAAGCVWGLVKIAKRK